MNNRAPGPTVHKLFILPSPDTVHQLQTLFMNCPFEIEWDQLGMEIGSSLNPIATKAPEIAYNAIPGSMDIWYDSGADEPHLLIPFFPSPKMARRHKEVGDAWRRPEFRPCLSLGIAPTLRRRTRAFINSIATALVDRSPVFTFAMETMITHRDCKFPEHGDFYRDYVGRGTVLNQVLLEQDEGIE